MPNYCSNTASIYSSDPSMIAALVAEIEKEKPELFDLILPTPPELKDGDGWYDWRVDNWGTKWNPSDITVYEAEPNEIKIHFLTAWSPPIELYEFMTKEGYRIEAAYSEEGVGFQGTYTSEEGDFCEPYDEDRDENGDLI